MPEEPTQGILIIEFGGSQTVSELARFLDFLGRDYSSFAHFDSLMSEIAEEVKKDDGPRWLKAKMIQERIEHDYDHSPLFIRALHIESPGWLEVLGSLNPLKWIHDYTKLILDHTSAAPLRKSERRKRELETDMLALKVLKQEVQLMKSVGISQDEIRAIVQMTMLRRFHDINRTFADARVRRLRLRTSKD